MNEEKMSCPLIFSFFSVLGLFFIILKLSHHIAWNWLWVLAPIWGPSLVASFCISVVGGREKKP